MEPESQRWEDMALSFTEAVMARDAALDTIAPRATFRQLTSIITGRNWERVEK